MMLMNAKKINLPTVRGEEIYIPFVGAIIERIENNKKQILIQTREKNCDKIHNGCIEIPGGKLRAFEDIYETVRREVKEECGLDITFIANENSRADFPNKENTSTLIQPFCVTQMIQGPFIGIIFLCKASGNIVKASDEAKDARWITVEELEKIVNHTPEKIYTPFLAPLIKYIKENLC